MKPSYFNSAGSLSSHVRNYPLDCFHIEQLPRKCTCGKTRVSYEVIDRQDNDVIELLILCPRCANHSGSNTDRETGMTVNGVSVCPAGEERYVFFNLTSRPGVQNRYCQYDYRTPDGELFSTVSPTLEQCRVKRDKWVLLKTAEN